MYIRLVPSSVLGECTLARVGSLGQPKSSGAREQGESPSCRAQGLSHRSRQGQRAGGIALLQGLSPRGVSPGPPKAAGAVFAPRLLPRSGRPKSGNSRVLLNFRDSTEFAHSTEFSPFLLLTIPVGPPYESFQPKQSFVVGFHPSRPASASASVFSMLLAAAIAL